MQTTTLIIITRDCFLFIVWIGDGKIFTVLYSHIFDDCNVFCGMREFELLLLRLVMTDSLSMARKRREKRKNLSLIQVFCYLMTDYSASSVASFALGAFFVVSPSAFSSKCFIESPIFLFLGSMRISLAFTICPSFTISFGLFTAF